MKNSEKLTQETDMDSGPYWKGYQAGMASRHGEPNNPYPKDSPQALEWGGGFEEGYWNS